MSSLAFNVGVIPFSGHRVHSRKHRRFSVQDVPTMIAANRSIVTGECNLQTTDLMGKIGKKVKGNKGNITVIEAGNMATNLCIIDSLQRLGVARYYQTEIDSVLDDTYRLWQRKEREICSDISIHAMAFRLLRVEGYQVSSEELAPYAVVERMELQTLDVPTVVELYRASQESLYEEEENLEKLHGWTTNFLMHQLQANSIPDKKLHKLVEYYLRNYHGIIHRIGVRRNLDMYDTSYYQTLKAPDRFANLCNEDFLAFARRDFNICQAQHRKELDQLQRWYVDCRLNTLNFGRDVVRIAHFMASAIISGDSKFSKARLALAKHVVLVTRADDFFDHGGTREECSKIIELVNEWKEKPAAEYGSEKVEIMFKAVYNTVNEIAEMAQVEQGRGVEEFLIGMWVEILSIFKMELDTWSDETDITLDEYMSSSWVSIGCRICSLMAMQFIGVKLSDEMLVSEECHNLCKHVSLVNRLLNDVQTFEKERQENTGSSVTILVAAAKRDGRGDVGEEEAIRKIIEIVEYNRRKLMQIVYERGSVFPRECKDVFLNFCRAGCYAYGSSDEFSSPQQLVMEDMKALIHEPARKI